MPTPSVSPKYVITSTSTVSTKSGAGLCDLNDINVKYTINKNIFNELSTNYPLGMMLSNILNNNLNQIGSNYNEILNNLTPNSVSNPSTYSLDICVPSKCSNGNKPINFGKLLGINKQFSANPLDIYGCLEPTNTNNICKFGMKLNNDMCFNPLNIYPKNN